MGLFDPDLTPDILDAAQRFETEDSFGQQLADFLYACFNMGEQ